MGGVGGIHLMTLTRLGIGSFHVADPDGFDLANFNRQYGASMRTLGQNKAEVMAEEALAVNPELDIKVFAEKVTPENVGAVLDGVEALLYVGRSSTQVRAGYAEAFLELFEEDERERATTIRLQQWQGTPDAGKWLDKSELRLPAPAAKLAKVA